MKNLKSMMAGGLAFVVFMQGAEFARAADAPLRSIGALPASRAADVKDFRQQADALYRMKVKAFLQGDPNAIVDRFYAEDAISIGPDGLATIGREALRASYKEVMSKTPATVRIEPFRTHVGKDAAWEWVNFHFIPKDASVKPMTSLMLFIWAKGPEGWVSGGDAFVLTEKPFPVKTK